MGHNSARGDNSDKKKIRVSFFFMKNPYMKFQNPSLKFFRTDGQTDARMDGQAKTNMLPTFSKVWGIKSNLCQHDREKDRHGDSSIVPLFQSGAIIITIFHLRFAISYRGRNHRLFHRHANIMVNSHCILGNFSCFLVVC